jgi:hypothetical protein
MRGPIAEALSARLPQVERASSIEQLEIAAHDPRTVVFIDTETLEQLDRRRIPLPCPVILLCDGPLQTAVGVLSTHPSLSHVVSVAMLQHAMANAHLASVVASFEENDKPRLLDWVRESLTGRSVGLTRASRRIERLEKMAELFTAQGVTSRTVQLLRDVADELLTNAFYDAPYAAGASSKPIARTTDVLLPEATPCDLIYGCSDDFAIVRVRDPFGAFSRARIVDVLTRCARTDMGVEVDESSGGAGLGLWRVFSVASFVAISVVRGHHTDILVGIGKRTAGAQRPYAFHLFFRDAPKRRTWSLDRETDTDCSFVTPSKADAE